MDTYIIDDLLEMVDEIIAAMNEYEGTFYVAIEAAHQLRDEIQQTAPIDSDDE